MPLLTLPPWVKEGQQIRYRPNPAHSDPPWTIGGINLQGSMKSAEARIWKQDKIGYMSRYISLRELLKDWEPTK